MLINRNNYEDFFLLYADGELRADERKAVEDFVVENEDLRIELDLIKATVLPEEEIVFVDKSFLYKETVFDSSLQEKLLLKLDAELTGSELESVNALIASNIYAKKEYGYLLNTKLDVNEKIVFDHKHLLYKKERDTVVVLRFARWAAAAVLVGVALFFAENIFNRRDEAIGETVVASKVNNKKNALEEAYKADDTVNAKPANNVVNEKQVVQEEKEEIKQTNNKGNYVLVNERIANKNGAPVKEDILSPKQEQLALVEKEKLDVEAQQKIVTAVSNTQMAVLKDTEKPKLVVVDDNLVPLENTYKQAMAITEMEKSENKILYMDEDDVKRSKAGGFLRKIKRFVERTAKIKTGNSLQIAGFEIAAK